MRGKNTTVEIVASLLLFYTKLIFNTNLTLIY